MPGEGKDLETLDIQTQKTILTSNRKKDYKQIQTDFLSRSPEYSKSRRDDESQVPISRDERDQWINNANANAYKGDEAGAI